MLVLGAAAVAPRALGAGDDLLHFGPWGGGVGGVGAVTPTLGAYTVLYAGTRPEHVRGSRTALGSHEESHEI